MLLLLLPLDDCSSSLAFLLDSSRDRASLIISSKDISDLSALLLSLVDVQPCIICDLISLSMVANSQCSRRVWCGNCPSFHEILALPVETCTLRIQYFSEVQDTGLVLAWQRQMFHRCLEVL